MTVREIARVIGAHALCGEDQMDRQVDSAFGSDMMSDVLAFVKEDTLLLTGLVNIQSIRTAELVDVPCVVFVRGKEPAQDVIDMARGLEIPLLATAYSMYEACGRLYMAGLPPLKLAARAAK